MSEIKGQLLGIILVVTIFGLVGGALTAIFYSLAHTVEVEVTDKVENYDHVDVPNQAGSFQGFNYLTY